MVTKTDILPGFKTDHSMISMSLTFQDIPRTKSPVWRLNTSLLYDTVWVEHVKTSIQQTLLKYVDGEVGGIENLDNFTIPYHNTILLMEKEGTN